MSSNARYPAQGVLGPIPSDELRITSVHEHLIATQLNWFIADSPVAGELGDEPVTLQNVGRIRRDPLCNRQNLVLDDLEEAIGELSEFKVSGGSTIVDLTNDGFGRDPESLHAVAERTNVNIIMGSGYYVADTHPPNMSIRSVEDCAQEIIDDIRVGVKDTGVRAGIIGEIGCSDGIHPDEEKALRAAAMAQRETGAPIAIHQPIPLSRGGRPAPGREALRILDILESEGTDLEHVLMCHMDHSLHDSGYHKAVANRGCMLAFDRFGNEWYYDSLGQWYEWRDTERVEAIRWLIDHGHEDQVTAGQDICYRICLLRYGGWGYGHLLRNVIAMFEKTGIDQGLRR
ncbi:MAG: phosphotriesterase family protein, partial [bacterium]